MNAKRLQFLEDLKCVLDRAIHDCNNELTGILLNCDMAKPENLEKKIGVIRARARKVIAVQRSLSAQSKLDTNADPQKLKVDDALAAVNVDYRADFTEKNITFTIGGPGGLEIMAAPAFLTELLNYLLQNSIDLVAGSDTRNITVTVEPKRLIFKDSGVMLEADVIERMFVSGHRRSHASFALTIAATIINFLNGKLEYKRAGSDNHFTVTFP